MALPVPLTTMLPLFHRPSIPCTPRASRSAVTWMRPVFTTGNSESRAATPVASDSADSTRSRPAFQSAFTRCTPIAGALPAASTSRLPPAAITTLLSPHQGPSVSEPCTPTDGDEPSLVCNSRRPSRNNDGSGPKRSSTRPVLRNHWSLSNNGSGSLTRNCSPADSTTSSFARSVCEGGTGASAGALSCRGASAAGSSASGSTPRNRICSPEAKSSVVPSVDAETVGASAKP